MALQKIICPMDVFLFNYLSQVNQGTLTYLHWSREKAKEHKYYFLNKRLHVYYSTEQCNIITVCLDFYLWHGSKTQAGPEEEILMHMSSVKHNLEANNKARYLISSCAR